MLDCIMQEATKAFYIYGTPGTKRVQTHLCIDTAEYYHPVLESRYIRYQPVAVPAQ
jgi:hypothetical protein